MKSSIWATCPKCQAELKIETDETELVQIECPDCHKIFAAKVPPRPTTPVRDIFAQAPNLPPFQPAHVHYKSRPQTRHSSSDGSLNPLALTAIIFLCASAILIPLGFGAYYIYGKVMESAELAATKPINTSPSTNASASSDTSSFAPPDDIAILDRSPKTPLITEPAWTPGMQPPGTSGQPDFSSPDLPNFPVPQLDPPPLMRPDSSGSSQIEMAANGSGSDSTGLSSSLQKFTAPNGVLIFVLHSSGTNVPMANLVSSLSVRDSYIEGDSDHSTIGLSYTGDLQNVVKQIQFGKVTFVDEETRTIHVQVN